MNMENELQENEINLLEIWKKLQNNKFLIIIITFIITLIGSIGVFVLNKSSRVITNKFEYHFTGSGVNIFPDGSLFNFDSYVSLEFLEEIKESNESFSNLNIKEMLKNEKSNFSFIEATQDDKATNKSYFSITLPYKYFKNIEQAEDFLKAIHKNILDEAIIKNDIFNDYNYFDYTSFQSFTDGKGYEEIITLIETQHQIISSSTTSFLEEFGSVVSDNKDLSELFKNYQLWYSNTVRTRELREQILENSWVNAGSDTIRKAKLRLNDLKRKFELIEKNIEDLTKAANDFQLPGNGESDVFLRKIEELIIEKNIIARKCMGLEN